MPSSRSIIVGRVRGRGMMERLIAGQDAVFRGTDLAPLQAEIIEQLIVERAKMLPVAMGV